MSLVDDSKIKMEHKCSCKTKDKDKQYFIPFYFLLISDIPISYDWLKMPNIIFVTIV